jgi:hypothetical protein
MNIPSTEIETNLVRTSILFLRTTIKDKKDTTSTSEDDDDTNDERKSKSGCIPRCWPKKNNWRGKMKRKGSWSFKRNKAKKKAEGNGFINVVD